MICSSAYAYIVHLHLPVGAGHVGLSSLEYAEIFHYPE
jgi:hypothetical protein